MYSIIFTILICLLIIYLVDQLIHYLRDTYTTKKTKDIVGYQIKKYQNLMDELHENKQKQPINHENIQESNELKLTNADLIAMNNELNSLITDEMQ
jgi:hypothetical protein|tara:strand:+ start:220 stop:507 length:288 start_codon:yes stop_codon:yes gene_type:complete